MVLVSEAMLRLLVAVGDGRGCVIVLEDLHWADPETLAVIDYLADHAAAEPVLCLGTFRPDETLPATAALRTRWLVERRGRWRLHSWTRTRSGRWHRRASAVRRCPECCSMTS
jgi:hypothetical protein